MSNTIVSIIIPNWNGLDHLEICLPSISKQTFKNFEVIVVDNGSSDQSVDFVKTNFPNFKIIKFKKNWGFSKAVNVGIKYSTSNYIFLLNNDTEIDKNCLKYLLEAAKSHLEVGFIAAKILNFSSRNLIDNAGDYIDSVGHLHSRGFGKKDGPEFSREQYIFASSGGGSLFKREVFKKVGYLDEDYFFYMEDIDLCLRAQLAGFKGWYQPKARIYHRRMGSVTKLENSTEPLIFKNMTQTVIKSFPRTLLLNNLNLLKIILVHLNTIKYLFSKGLILETIKVEIELILNLKKILAKRKKVQSLKAVSDGYLLANIPKRKFKVGKLLSW